MIPNLPYKPKNDWILYELLTSFSQRGYRWHTGMTEPNF